MLIPKLKDPDPNPGVTISILTTIGEQAQVGHMTHAIIIIIIIYCSVVCVVESEVICLLCAGVWY